MGQRLPCRARLSQAPPSGPHAAPGSWPLPGLAPWLASLPTTGREATPPLSASLWRALCGGLLPTTSMARPLQRAARASPASTGPPLPASTNVQPTAVPVSRKAVSATPRSMAPASKPGRLSGPPRAPHVNDAAAAAQCATVLTPADSGTAWSKPSPVAQAWIAEAAERAQLRRPGPAFWHTPARTPTPPSHARHSTPYSSAWRPAAAAFAAATDRPSAPGAGTFCSVTS